MELSLPEVARLLSVSEPQVHTWMGSLGLPVYHIHDEVRFNRDEVVEWAAVHHFPVALEALGGQPKDGLRQPVLLAALERGGIVHDLPGRTRPDAFREIVNRLPLPPDFDREMLIHMLEAREKALTTGVGRGIAIPHVKTPVILPGHKSLVMLAFLHQELDFGAADQKPVYCLFTLVTPSIGEHILLLSHLATVLREETFTALLQRRAPAPEILAALAHLEPRPVAGQP